MVWGSMSVADCQREFVGPASAEEVNFRKVCRRFGVSPKTGYKWQARCRAAG